MSSHSFNYLERLIAENSYLRMSGVMQVNRQVDIFLDQIYVSLKAQRRQLTESSKHSHREFEVTAVDSYTEMMDGSPSYRDKSSYYPSTSSTKTVVQKVDLSEAVRENRYSVILGAPGAGKTTLLRYLTLHFAIAKRDNQEKVIVEQEKELGKTLLPIFCRIADYAEQLRQQPELTLLEYLNQFHYRWKSDVQSQEEIEVEVAMLLDAIRQGKCLILMDGLDEVFDQQNRRGIVERINQFVEEFPTNKFVVTSRIAGYHGVQLSDRFTEFTIEDMDSEQVESFLYRWCPTIEKVQQPEAGEEQWQRKGIEQAQDILKAIEDNEGVKRLTANPLLLTILALIHRNGEHLPERRVKLYELAVQTLIEDWQLSKKLPDAPKVMLKETEVVQLLAPLAYWMHEEKPSGLVTQAEVEEKLAIELANLNDTNPKSNSVRQEVTQFLRKVRETTGLFVERTPGVYGFMHLTFEEYFAARYIADKDPSELLQLIEKHRYESRWDEPLLLTLGYYGNFVPTQLSKLLEKLFFKLKNYEPVLQNREIKIEKSSSNDTKLIWLKADSAGNFQQAELKLKDLLFAGQAIAEVDAKVSLRKEIIQKLVLTYVGIDDEDDVTQKLLKLLRKIELFHQKTEVIDILKEIADDETLSSEIQIKVKTAILYIACCDLTRLIDYAVEIVNQLKPELFCSIMELLGELGEDITSALEISQNRYNFDTSYQNVLVFLTGISYLREDKYEKATRILEDIGEKLDNSFRPYLSWALTKCYEEREEYEKANNCYYQSNLADYLQKNSLLTFWIDWGWCQRLDKKYEQSLLYYQKALAIAEELLNSKHKAKIFYNIGRVYQDWGKYEQAINYHQQSQKLYQQLGREKNVANQWCWMAICNKDWGKYEQAIECTNQNLALRQQLDNQMGIAAAYYQLGQISQAWGKYAQAINYHQQSQETYQQLGREKNVAKQWCWMAICYTQWGKYEQAIECANQGLALCQQLDDQMGVASAYNLTGRIYQDLGKYAQAINHYQQSQETYQQLGREKSVANQWYWMADCNREWGKYEQAIECANQNLALRQQLDDQRGIADAYYQLGRNYQAWDKYEQAINYHQQSQEVYQRLRRKKSVADQWYWKADCNREWGKYEQAVECANQGLALCQQLDDQMGVASAYNLTGRIYQDLGKYAQAINHYQQSQELYQQLGWDKDVADLWYWMADCNREWGKYKQAVECANQNLALRQQLDDQRGIADAYYQLGRNYQAWGKYEQAINYHQQSQEVYQRLRRKKSVADQWYWKADCNREWGKYEQAVECANQDLALRQQLDDQVNIALAYYQLGRIYQAWGKYEQAINYYQQSQELYQQLGWDKDVADLWYWMADCNREWGKYKQAVECANQDLALRQQLDDQVNIADAYYQLGRIYQAWGKYEQAINYYQQSQEIYQQLGREKAVADLWYWMADCNREWGKYEQAVEYANQDLALRHQLDDQVNIADAYNQLGYIYREWGLYEQAIKYFQDSCNLYKHLNINESEARILRKLTYAQILLAKTYQNEALTLNLLTQAEQNLLQAIQLNTIGNYKENLAYDYTVLGLLYSERLRFLPSNDSLRQEQITQFEQHYLTGFTYLTELGQTFDRADEALDMARAYLEVEALENLDRAQEIAQECLQIFNEYNRYKQKAAALKLLGEIFLKRTQQNYPNTQALAIQFFSESLQIYQELDLYEKAIEVEQLIPSSMRC